jgi:hypothetical protein
VRDTVRVHPVPATADDLDPQFRRFLDLQAARAGVSTQALLDEVRARREAELREHDVTDAALAAIRARR